MDSENDRERLLRRINRRSFLKASAAAGVGLAGMSILAACGGSTTTTPEATQTETGTATESTTPATTATETATEAASPTTESVTGGGKKGGTLTIAVPSDLDNFDPHTQWLVIMSGFMRDLMYNSVAMRDENVDPVPDLAESWDMPDDKTYVFKLRDGAKFHNGRDVTAEDVKFSLERMAGIGSAFSPLLADIGSMEVVDSAHLKVNLKSVSAKFLSGLPYTSILPKEAIDTLKQKPVGSGPFKFVEWVANDHITLEKFGEYFDKEIPYLDKVIAKPIPEPQVAITNLESGAIDGIFDVPLAQAVPFKDSKDITYGVPKAPGDTHVIEMMGKNSKAIHDVRVRQALAHAMDKDAINKTVFFGEAESHWTPFPSYSWAYEEQPGFPFDLAKAKDLLTQAGYGDGFEFTAEVPTGYPDGERICTIWQAGLAEIGVKLNINVSELSQWLEKFMSHNYDVTWNSYPGIGDPAPFMDIQYGPHLSDQYQNAEVIQLMKEGNESLDREARKKTYSKLQKVLVEEMPILVVASRPFVCLSQPYVKGLIVRPDDAADARGVWLDK